MRKFYIMVLVITMLMLSGCAGKDEQVVELTSTPEITPEPTLEEVVGCTGEELSVSETLYTFKRFSLVATYSVTEMNGDVPIEHQVKEKYTYDTDSVITSIWYTNTDVVDGTEHFNTAFYYGDSKNKVVYSSLNYDGWSVSEMQSDMIYNTSLGSGVTVSDFTKEGYTLIVEGYVNKLGTSSLDLLIKSVLNKYGIDEASYTYTAKYGEIDKQFQRVSALVTPSGTGEIDGNRVTIGNLAITVIMPDADSMSLIGIPDYVKAAAMNAVEPEPEMPNITESEEFDISLPLCESLFDVQADIDSVVAYLNETGFTADSLSGSTGLDGNLVLSAMSELLTYLSYDSFVDYDYESASAEAKAAYDLIKLWCEQRVIQQPEVVPESEETVTPEPTIEPTKAPNAPV